MQAEIHLKHKQLASALATLEQLGGSAQIVGDHLRRAMRELTSDEQATAAGKDR